jgi:hypothetical protein
MFMLVNAWATRPTQAPYSTQPTKAGLMAARARGRLGGRPRKMTATTLKMAMTAMADPSSPPKEVARRLGITTSTLYAYVNGDGSLKEPGRRLVDRATGFPEESEKLRTLDEISIC